MKPFLVALVAIVVLAVGANLALHELGFSSAQSYSADGVRVN